MKPLLRFLRVVWQFWWVWGGAVLANAEASDLDQYVQYNRRLLGAYAAGLGFDLESCDDEGFELRGGYSRWGTIGDTLIFYRGGVLLGYHFSRKTYSLVPEVQLGLAPVFVGLSYPLADRPRFGELTYEFGLTALFFDAKIMTADFKKTSFSFSFHLPSDEVMENARRNQAMRSPPN